MTTDQQAAFLVNHTVDEMSKFLTEDFNLDIPSALNVIYNSRTFSLLLNKETELYIQSPSYVYEMLRKEYLTGKIN